MVLLVASVVLLSTQASQEVSQFVFSFESLQQLASGGVFIRGDETTIFGIRRGESHMADVFVKSVRDHVVCPKTQCDTSVEYHSAKSVLGNCASATDFSGILYWGEACYYYTLLTLPVGLYFVPLNCCLKALLNIEISPLRMLAF